MTKDFIKRLAEECYQGGRVEIPMPDIKPMYLHEWDKVDIPMMIAYGKGGRTIITPAYSHYGIGGIEMRDYFKTRDQDKTPPGLERMWREQGLHLKSSRAKCYSDVCRLWLNDPLDDLSKVMENRGYLLLERALHSEIAEARYAAMKLYMFMAASNDPPHVEGEE